MDRAITNGKEAVQQVTRSLRKLRLAHAVFETTTQYSHSGRSLDYNDWMATSFFFLKMKLKKYFYVRIRILRQQNTTITRFLWRCVTFWKLWTIKKELVRLMLWFQHVLKIEGYPTKYWAIELCSRKVLTYICSVVSSSSWLIDWIHLECLLLHYFESLSGY